MARPSQVDEKPLKELEKKKGNQIIDDEHRKVKTGICTSWGPEVQETKNISLEHLMKAAGWLQVQLSQRGIHESRVGPFCNRQFLVRK